MVVVWVVKISNASSSPVHLEYSVGFLTEWNSPKVDGAEPPYVIMPGFTSETVTDFAVPQTGAITLWTEGEEEQKVEIFVAPRPNGSAEHAWIQYRKPSGEPIAEERWFFVGQNQMFGGRHVEYEFKIKARISKGIGKAISFSPFSVYGPSDVLLNVYDLAQHVSSFNGLFANQAYNLFGFFHSGIEVYGEEWSFYRTESNDQCGICQSRTPKIHSVHVFRQSVFLGRTTFSHAQVREILLTRLKPYWSGGSYDLLEKNCISFCDAFALTLGVERCPSWVRNLHESAYSITTVFPFLRNYFTGGDEIAIGDLPEGAPRISSSDASSSSNILSIGYEFGLDSGNGGFAWAEPLNSSRDEDHLWRPPAHQGRDRHSATSGRSSVRTTEGRGNVPVVPFESVRPPCTLSPVRSAENNFEIAEQEIPNEKPEKHGGSGRKSDRAPGHSLKDSTIAAKEVPRKEEDSDA